MKDLDWEEERDGRPVPIKDGLPQGWTITVAERREPPDYENKFSLCKSGVVIARGVEGDVASRWVITHVNAPEVSHIVQGIMRDFRYHQEQKELLRQREFEALITKGQQERAAKLQQVVAEILGEVCSENLRPQV